MSKKLKEFSSAGGVAGFQVPIGIKKRKKKVDELLELNEDVSVVEAIGYFAGLDEESSIKIESMLDESDYVKLAELIKNGFAENAIRGKIRKRVKEIVRKQSDGQFALYAPNPGKQHGSKQVGKFPTKLAARRAELNSFPPKDPSALNRLRQDVEKLRKNPELASKKDDPSWLGQNKTKKKPQTKKESISRIVKALAESLFREEKKGSDWDEYVSKLSKQAVLADKTFQSHQKTIAKKSEKTLKDSVKLITAALASSEFQVKDSGIKKDQNKEKVYAELSASDKDGLADVGPIYIFIENGYPKIEMSDGAKNALTKLDPERGKVLRAELITVQDDLDKDNSVVSAVEKRDAYLNKIEKKADDFVSNMTSLEITILKRILSNKFRKIK